MSNFQLRTLGTIEFRGPRGAVPLDDPRFVALLALLAVSGDAGIEEDDLVVLLTPDATSAEARNEIDRLLALARSETGGDALIVHPGSRYAFAPGAVSLDVDVRTPGPATHCAAFLSGFHLADSPEFGEWLESARRRVQPRAAGIPEPSRAEAAVAPVLAGDTLARRSWRRPLIAGLAVAAAVVLTVTLLARNATPGGVAGFTAGDPVLLADLANETGDTLFDRGIVSAASIALQQSGHLRLYSRSRLAGVYRRMQVGNRDTSLTYEFAQEVAERDNVRFVLGLRLYRTGEGYRVSARLADVELGREVAENSEAAEREDEILAALDRVLLTIRARLGETRQEMSERRQPLPLVTTTSLEALRSFAEGSAAWNNGNYHLAGELWQRAVDLDTGFAMAYGALGNWHYYHHDRASGERYYGEALRRTVHLTEWERLRILDGLAGYRGNTDSALAISRVMADRFPNVVTWYNYGTSLLGAGRHVDALEALRTALTFDSLHVDSHINMATSANGLGRHEEALLHYRDAGALDSTALYRNNVNHEWGGTYVRLGRVVEAESVFRRMVASTKIGDRALGLRSMGFLAMWRGRLGQSIDFFSQATEATVQMKSSLSEARNRLLLATALRTATRVREADAQVTRVLGSMRSPQFEPPFLAMLAINCVRQGRPTDADSVLSLLRTRVDKESAMDRSSESLVAGALALARGQPDSALLLFGAPSTRRRVYITTMRAEAFLASGQRDSARVAFEALLAVPIFGAEGQDEWQQAPFALGEVLGAEGDRAGAAKAYRRYLEQWRDAPPALPRLVAARARLEALGQ